MSNKKPPRLKLRDGKYYVYYSEHGRDQRKSLRTKDLQTAEARFAGWLEQHRKEVKVESDPLVSDCLDYWYEQNVKDKFLSEDRYQSLINNLRFYFGNMRVSQVTRNHSEEYKKIRISGHGYYKKVCKGSTVRTELQRLRACLNFMVNQVEPRERRISRSTIPYVELPPPSPPRDRVLSMEELESLWNFCKNLVWNGMGRPTSNRVHKIARFIMIAMETAQRKTAILELKWSQVKFDENMIYFLPEGKLQTIKTRPPVPISTQLRPILENAYAEKINDLVCDSTSNIHDQLKRVGEELNIDGLSAHVFRHTWATHKVMAGKPIEKIAAMMGDSVEIVRKNYAHLAPDYLKDVVD